MPKRVIDGEGLWRSDKLAQVSPAKYKPEYANVLPLALANGTFECNSARVWSAVYSYNRPEISRSDVDKMLQAFEAVGLLFRWTDENGKAWGYWTGSDKPGRLPSRSMRKHYGTGPEPPRDKLAEYLQRNGQASTESTSVPIGTEVRSREKAKHSTTLPEGFGVSDEVREWAKSKGYTRLEEHLEHFIGIAKAKGYAYLNWNQAFKNAIRDNWARLDRVPVSPKGKSVLERTKAQLEAQ